jgi:Beta-lactamase enzyme family
MKLVRDGNRAAPRHSRAVTSRGSPRALVAVATVLVVFAAVALLRFNRHGSDPLPSRPVAASTRPAAVIESASTSRSPSPLSPSPRPAMRGNPLGAAATAYLADRSGAVLAAVYDVRTGQTWSLGHGTPQAEASIVKLDILETLLAQRNAEGAALSARDMSLAQAMIEDSDNDAATSLWDEVGGARGISSFNASVGLTGTVPSACVECPGFPWPGWGLTTTTPADQIALLRELLRPSAQLTGSQREYALGLMENVTESQRWGVTGGVPSPVTVALKNGWLPLTSADDNWQVNSIGWISGDGRDYIMTVLTTRNPTEQYGIDTIDQLSAEVWDRLG